jgi:hypothetical protein
MDTRTAYPEQREAKTRFPDKDYNLISILYNSLQGAESCETYRKDAEHENDQELVQFFQEAQEHYMELAEKAKQLTKDRIR